jgi:hypothetical protein
MTRIGPGGFWLFLAVVMAAMTLYGLWRMTRRPTVYAEEEDYEAVSYATILPGTASVVAIETAQELYVEAAEELSENADDDGSRPGAAQE